MNNLALLLLLQPTDRSGTPPAAEERDAEGGGGKGIAAGVVLGVLGWICLAIGIVELI